MSIHITAAPGQRMEYVRPQTDAVQAKGRTSANSRDVVTISAQAREAMANLPENQETVPEKLEGLFSGTCTPEMIAGLEDLPQQTLEMSWWEKFGEEIGMSGAEVYQIAKDTYYHTYVQRMMDRRETIEAYYAGAHAETMSHANAMALKNHSDPFMEALDYIAQKYLWSPDLKLLKLNQPEYFRWDMGEEERRIAYDQERRLLFGVPVTLNDPYALASVGGVPYVKDEEEIAKQAARDKLEELRKQAQGGE